MKNSKLGKTDIHKNSTFSKARKKRTLENPWQLFYLHTVPLKYGTFKALIDIRIVPFKYGTLRAYHPLKLYLDTMRMQIFFFWYVTLLRYLR